jgi:hypothetical protein
VHLHIPRRRTIVAATLVALVCAPALTDKEYDSFPLSTYPMFAGHRDRVAAVHTAVVVDGGRVVRLSSELIGGSSEPMLAAENVVHAIGDRRAPSLCAEIARRAARRQIRGTIQVVVEFYDTERWFAGDHAPRSRDVFAQCEIRT